MNDLDIFFDKTVSAVKPTLLITNAYTLEKRMGEDIKKHGIKRTMDKYPHRDIDTIAAFKIATHDENDPTYEITGNEYFVTSTSEITLDKNGVPNHIYLEIPRVSYQFNPYTYFSIAWSMGFVFDVIWDTKNIGIGELLTCYKYEAKIKHASQKSPNNRSCITIEIIKDDV